MNFVKRPRVERVQLEFVTPLFLGGASNENNVPKLEFRPPSVKGALRFWHRACGLDAIKSEDELFGSTRKERARQSPFLLRLHVGGTRKPGNIRKIKDDISLKYLAYGLYAQDKQDDGGPAHDRPFYEPNNIVLNLEFVLKPSVTDDDFELIMRSVRLLSLFGGLGARSRRGFGSVVLSHQHMPIPKSTAELKNLIKQELTPLISDERVMPKYTMFSQKTRVVILPGKNNAYDSLKQAGSLLQRFRSKQNKDVNFAKEDMDLIKQFVRRQQIPHAPLRSAFGLPHNYANLRGIGDVEKVHITGQDGERRASPLFIHIHKIKNGNNVTYPIVFTYMPAAWFPNKESNRRGIRMEAITSDSRSSRQSAPVQQVSPPDFRAIEQFFDSLHKRFSSRVLEVTF